MGVGGRTGLGSPSRDATERQAPEGVEWNCGRSDCICCTFSVNYHPNEYSQNTYEEQDPLLDRITCGLSVSRLPGGQVTQPFEASQAQTPPPRCHRNFRQGRPAGGSQGTRRCRNLPDRNRLNHSNLLRIILSTGDPQVQPHPDRASHSPGTSRNLRITTRFF